MSAEPTWQLVRATFQSALELDPTRWSDWLQAREDLPARVRSEVQALLLAHRQADAETAPDRFRLLRVLGEGGFGTVHLAEQQVPVRRLVALKVLKAGMHSDQVVARFATEREALARMSHPHIAHIFDAGTLPDGRPYFAMEFVDGAPITHHCDQARLSLRQRLQLFVDVCRGVHHAHLKGVIHRDLKPSNVLVETVDGRSVAKIIDFGIAKATQGIGAGSEWTVEGRCLGTPAYMSPEQADLDGGQVDVRSDLYSLGVLLYELLTGALPFDPATKAEQGLLAVLQHIRSVDPPRPSTRLHTAERLRAEAAAAARGTLRPALQRALRGDLDWITMRALAKEPERRYQSAADLAADLERHLQHQPVQAGPPGLGYRLQKAFRRHRAASIAAALVLLSLVFGLVLALWQYSVARAALAVAVARRLSAQAISVVEDDPTLALQLAVRGAEGEASENADLALYTALQRCTEDWQFEVHEQAVTQLALAADGSRLLSGDQSGLVLCTDPRTGRVRHQFDEHGAAIVAVLISGDGRRGCSAGADGTAVLYDLDQGTVRATLRVGQPIRHAAWSTDGGVLALGLADGDVLVVRDPAQPPLRFRGRGQPVERVDVDGLGTVLAVLDGGNCLRVLDAVTGDQRAARDYPPLPAGADRTFEAPVLQFGRDPRRLLLRAPGGHGGLLDLGVGGGDWQPIPGRNYLHGALSPDDRRLFVSDDVGGMSVFDVATRQRVGELRGPRSSGVNLGCFDASGDRLVTVPVRAPVLQLWDVVRGTELLQLRGDPHEFHAVRFEPDGRHLLAGGQNGGLFRWRTAVFDESRALSNRLADGSTTLLELATDGRHALLAPAPPPGGVAHYQLVDVLTGAVCLLPLPPVGDDVRLRFGPRADALLVQSAGRVRLYALPGGELRHEGPMPLRIVRVAADLGRVAGIDPATGRLAVAELRTGRVVFAADSPDLRETALDATGALLATADGNRNSATVWDVDRGRCLGAVEHQGLVFAVQFLAATGELMSFANDTTARLTDPRTMKATASFRLPSADMAFGEASDDGRRFLVDITGTVFLFDAVARRRLLRLEVPAAQRRGHAFTLSPDGRSLCQVLADGGVRWLPLDPLAAARRLLPRPLDHDQMVRFDVGTEAERRAQLAADEARGENSKRLVARARAAIDAGELERAAALLARAEGRRRYLPNRFHVATAMLHALTAERTRDPAARAAELEAAMAALRRFVAGGFRDAQTLANLPQLAALRALPAFTELLAGLR